MPLRFPSEGYFHLCSVSNHFTSQLSGPKKIHIWTQQDQIHVRSEFRDISTSGCWVMNYEGHRRLHMPLPYAASLHCNELGYHLQIGNPGTLFQQGLHQKFTRKASALTPESDNNVFLGTVP